MPVPKPKDAEAHRLIGDFLRELVRVGMAAAVKAMAIRKKALVMSARERSRPSGRAKLVVLQKQFIAALDLLRLVTRELKRLARRGLNCFRRLDLSELKGGWPTPAEMARVMRRLIPHLAVQNYQLGRIEADSVPLFLTDLNTFDVWQYIATHFPRLVTS